MPRFENESLIFRIFADDECRGSSPLYEMLSHYIASDDELLEIAAQGNKPIPNNFLAAVHYLLMKNPGETLAHYYPDLNPHAQPDEMLFPEFRSFCLLYRRKIGDIIRTRYVQTNEVRRCAALFPAFRYIWGLGGRQSLSLMEIGSSAGLNLRWDQYGYLYNGTIRTGKKDATLCIEAELRGDIFPEFDDEIPDVAERIGIDLNPVLPSREDDIMWLKALIWPEHRKRREILKQALSMAEELEVEHLNGDGTELLYPRAERIAPGTTLCIFHTSTANQFSPVAMQRFQNGLQALSEQRPFYHLYRIEDLRLEIWDQGLQSTTRLAETDTHGSWLRWLHQV